MSCNLDQGRREGGLFVANQRPMMPGASSDETIGSKPPQVWESSKGLRVILIRVGSTPEEVAEVSSHAIKATCP